MKQIIRRCVCALGVLSSVAASAAPDPCALEDRDFPLEGLHVYLRRRVSDCLKQALPDALTSITERLHAIYVPRVNDRRDEAVFFSPTDDIDEAKCAAYVRSTDRSRLVWYSEAHPMSHWYRGDMQPIGGARPDAIKRFTVSIHESNQPLFGFQQLSFDSDDAGRWDQYHDFVWTMGALKVLPDGIQASGTFSYHESLESRLLLLHNWDHRVVIGMDPEVGQWLKRLPSGSVYLTRDELDPRKDVSLSVMFHDGRFVYRDGQGEPLTRAEAWGKLRDEFWSDIVAGKIMAQQTLEQYYERICFSARRETPPTL